jgi:pyridoxamine 5'-phosphate oxidase
LKQLSTPEDVLRWVTTEAADGAGIGIDAPIVVTNSQRIRIADRLAKSYYGKYHAGSYPLKKTRTFSKTISTFSTSLASLGFGQGEGEQRFLIEVHPYAASVQLFLLNAIVEYQKGSLTDRAGELARLRGLILERLPSLVPKLDLTELPEICDRGRDLKAAEDQLDALLAAYMAAHWWYWGRKRNTVVGGIVVPCRQQLDPVLLNEATMDANPLTQFEKWSSEADHAGLEEPGAATLATVSSKGQPSARMVMVREANARGFVFYTNYRSQKGRELATNPLASLVFYWPELCRQVRVSGYVSKTSQGETGDYFRTRPRGAQLSAWASWQSSVIPDREVLERRIQKVDARFANQEIPPPPGWGGFRLSAEMIEFWQGREDRLHDRIRYDLSKGRWTRERLAP